MNYKHNVMGNKSGIGCKRMNVMKPQASRIIARKQGYEINKTQDESED
jgi:hypothetical protein